MQALYDIGTPEPVPTPFNMAEYVLAAGLVQPEKTALEIISPQGREIWSYAQITRAVQGIATGLTQRGLVPGDIVLLRLGNTVDFPLAYLGALAAGLVPVPTSSALTEREVHYILNTLRPRLTLHAPDVACPVTSDTLSLAQLQDFRALAPLPFHRGDPNRLGYIIYTSGTSGQPRAVAHAHRAIWARRMMFDGWYGLRKTDRVLHAGAFNWTYTMGTGLMDPWTKGATALIATPNTPPDVLGRIISDTAASIFAAAPGVYRQILKSGVPLNAPGLRHGLSAGEKLPQQTATGWLEATGTHIFEAYGMSECSTFISSAPPNPARAGSLGYPQNGRKVCLRDETGIVARDQEGTISVHSSDPGLMLGYRDETGKITLPLTDGWFLTGDQGTMDDTGAITSLGRNDDMMNAGGFRVSPIEVENAITPCPGITSVAVAEVAVKNDTLVIAAFYTGPAPLDDAALHAYVNDKLARYKQPRLFIHLPALPMGANGKILRRALRDQYKAHT